MWVPQRDQQRKNDGTNSVDTGFTMQRSLKDPEELRRVIDLLEQAGPGDHQGIHQHLPEYLSATVPLVRISALDYIGRQQLVRYQREVELALADATPLVRVHALQTLFDLDRDRAAPALNNFVEDPNPGVMLMALVLLYVLNQDAKTLDEIKKIVSDDYDYHYLSTLTLNTLTSYLEIKDHPEVIALIETMRDNADEGSDFHDEATEVLKQD